MTFPAPLDVGADADVGLTNPAGPEGPVGIANHVDPGERDLKATNAGALDDAGERDRPGDDVVDVDGVLIDAATGSQLLLASAGVLPELAGLPERQAAYARAARAANTPRGYCSD